MTRISVQIVLILGCALLIINGAISPVMLVVLCQLSGSIINPLYSIVDNVITIKSAASVKEKIMEIVSEDESKQEEHGQEKMKCNQLTFDQVAFGYDEKMILNDFSFQFEKNKKYALVGESGSGKSTVLRLILRYYDSIRGRFFLTMMILEK